VVEAVPQILTAAIRYKYIPFMVKHLVFKELGRKHAVMVHYYFSLAHYNGAFLIAFNVKLESFLL
jgi:hypothetical protein